MSKTPQHPSSGGSIRGDVSFIRATSNPSISAGSSSTSIATSNQNIEQLTAQHFVSTSVTSPHSTPENPHQHQHHLHHHQHSQRQHQQQQQLHMQQQPYLPEHMDPQQYMLKQGQGHGAGGASGDSVRLSSHTGVEGWSDREEALAAELDEAKIRVAQMEKTMRWWSDCTSNWREKWNKARNERNKAREENRLLRTKLESLAKELSRLKREKKENALEKDLNPEESLTSTVSNSSKSQEKHSELSEKERSTITGISEKESESVGDSGDLSSLKSRKKEGLHSNTEKDLDDVEIAGGEGSLSSGSTAMTTEVADRLSQLQERQAHLEQELTQALRKASQAAENSLVMQRKLDEANNTVQAERLEKCNHLKTIEILQQQVTDLQESARENEDLRHSLKMEQSTDSERSLEDVLDKVTEQHKQELARLTLDLEDETSSRSTMDRRVTELRRELERIQAENASEWAKRERLESEKLALE
ncbi:coiled-coil domain-containing protein 102A, partial [Aplysia californica]|uniref:Coiled-coil domain-containing protein 102A n=1 Tax=Aplysia californica TaxID=6500 RepID=A0ABM0ZV63_APLCA